MPPEPLRRRATDADEPTNAELAGEMSGVKTILEELRGDLGAFRTEFRTYRTEHEERHLKLATDWARHDAEATAREEEIRTLRTAAAAEHDRVLTLQVATDSAKAASNSQRAWLASLAAAIGAAVSAAGLLWHIASTGHIP